MKEEELPDISLQEALNEVRAAQRMVDTKRKMLDFNRTLDLRRQEDRWHAMYEFLWKYNPEARAALRQFNKDVQSVRAEKNDKASGKHMKHSLSMPPVLWDALSMTDPDIKNFDLLDTHAKTKLVNKLGRAFPNYWMART